MSDGSGGSARDADATRTPASAGPGTVFTIGHSTRTIVDFVELLRGMGVDMVVDIRSFPHSRANPQYDIEALPRSLADCHIDYRHLAALGGRRQHRRDAPPSTNTLWRVAAFRDYADYAETDAFRAGLDELIDLAHEHRSAIMCAEAVWWRCHRRIVADYLLARGIPVQHIMGVDRVSPAVLTEGARVAVDGTIRYPGAAKDPPSR